MATLGEFDEVLLKRVTTGASLKIVGTVVESLGKGQTVEVKAKTIEIEDLDYTPFDSQGGRGKMHQLFGKEMDDIINELNEILILLDTDHEASRVRRALCVVHPRSRSLSGPLPQQPPAPSVIIHGRSQHCACKSFGQTDCVCVRLMTVSHTQRAGSTGLTHPVPARDHNVVNTLCDLYVVRVDIPATSHAQAPRTR